MPVHPSLIIITLLLAVGIRFQGVLIGGVIFTYQLGALSDMPWIGPLYIAVATLISVVRYAIKPHKIDLQVIDLGILAIVLLSAVSVTWSVDPDSSFGEVLDLFLWVAGAYGVARFVSPDNGQIVRAMLWTIVIVSPLISILLLNQRETIGWTAQDRLLIDGSSASAVGISQPFAGCLLACSMLLLMRVPVWQKGFVLGALATVAYAAIATGTRSVFLAYAGGLVVFLALGVKSIKIAGLLQLIFVIVVLIITFISFAPIEDFIDLAPIENLSQSAERLLGVTSSVGQDASSRERLVHYSIAWEQFLLHPLHGIGDGGLFRFDSIPYPHNLILEILLEFGIIGAVVFGAWFFALFREAAYVRAHNRELGTILIAFIALVVIQHQVSYSFAMARTLFLVCALLAAYGGAYRLAAKQRRARHASNFALPISGRVLRPGP